MSHRLICHRGWLQRLKISSLSDREQRCKAARWWWMDAEKNRDMRPCLCCVCFDVFIFSRCCSLLHSHTAYCRRGAPPHTNTHARFHTLTHMRTHGHIRSCVLQRVWVWLWAIDDDSRAICWCISVFHSTAIRGQPMKHYTVSTLISSVNAINAVGKWEKPSSLYRSLTALHTMIYIFIVMVCSLFCNSVSLNRLSAPDREAAACVFFYKWNDIFVVDVCHFGQSDSWWLYVGVMC